VRDYQNEKLLRINTTEIDFANDSTSSRTRQVSLNLSPIFQQRVRFEEGAQQPSKQVGKVLNIHDAALVALNSAALSASQAGQSKYIRQRKRKAGSHVNYYYSNSISNTYSNS